MKKKVGITDSSIGQSPSDLNESTRIESHRTGSPGPANHFPTWHQSYGGLPSSREEFVDEDDSGYADGYLTVEDTFDDDNVNVRHVKSKGQSQSQSQSGSRSTTPAFKPMSRGGNKRPGTGRNPSEVIPLLGGTHGVIPRNEFFDPDEESAIQTTTTEAQKIEKEKIRFPNWHGRGK